VSGRQPAQQNKSEAEYLLHNHRAIPIVRSSLSEPIAALDTLLCRPYFGTVAGKFIPTNPGLH